MSHIDAFSIESSCLPLRGFASNAKEDFEYAKMDKQPFGVFCYVCFHTRNSSHYVPLLTAEDLKQSFALSSVTWSALSK